MTNNPSMTNKQDDTEQAPLEPVDRDEVESARRAIQRHLKRRNKRDSDYQKKFGRKA